MGTITYNTARNNPAYIFRATGGGVVFSANLTGLAVFDYFTDAPAVNDAIYFSSNLGYTPFSDVYLNVGTAMAGTDIVLVWEYYSATTASWVTCHDLTDNTVGFTVPGAGTVVFPFQAGGFRVSVAGLAATMLWVRCRLVSFTTVTEGGANQTTAAKVSDGVVTCSGYTDGSPCTLTLLVDWLIANAPQVNASRSGPVFAIPHAKISFASRLRSIGEVLYYGNGSVYSTTLLVYWHSGTKVGVDGYEIRDSTTIFYCFSSTSTVLNSSAGTLMYGGALLMRSLYIEGALRNATGYGIAFAGGELIGVTFSGMGSLVTGAIIKCITGGPLLLATITATVDRLEVASSVSTIFNCFFGSWVMLNVTYAKESATTSVLYIPNYNSDFTWDFVNPVPAFPRLGEAIVPCGRLVGSVSNVTKCFRYVDATGVFTDYTAQARSIAADDVPLGSAVGDCLYLLYSSISQQYGPSWTFDITNQANDYTYCWEYYTAAGWVVATTWDLTHNMTVSGKVFMQEATAPASVTINGTSGMWVRHRVVSAGVGTPPVVSRIRPTLETGMSNWLMSEKYELDLTVRDTAGAAIVGAAVVITDSDGVVQYSGVTGAGGVMVQQTLTSAKWWFDPLDPASSGSPQYIVERVYGAYTITVSKSGYRTSVNHITLTQKTALTMPLETQVGHSAVM